MGAFAFEPDAAKPSIQRSFHHKAVVYSAGQIAGPLTSGARPQVHPRHSRRSLSRQTRRLLRCSLERLQGRPSG